MNVVHVTPFAVAEGIIRGAGHCLAETGLLLFYGPFHIDGAPTGPGNVAFDAGLRKDNPEWGVRDTADLDRIARKSGLRLWEAVPMPSDNRILVFRR